jgi:hypothetical protein
LKFEFPGLLENTRKYFQVTRKYFRVTRKYFHVTRKYFHVTQTYSKIFSLLECTRKYFRVTRVYSNIHEHTRTNEYFGGDFTQNCTHIQHSHRFTQQNNNHETMRESLSSQANPSSQSGRRSICDPQTAIGINAENAIKISWKKRRPSPTSKSLHPAPEALSPAPSRLPRHRRLRKCPTNNSNELCAHLHFYYHDRSCILAPRRHSPQRLKRFQTTHARKTSGFIQRDSQQ